MYIPLKNILLCAEPLHVLQRGEGVTACRQDSKAVQFSGEEAQITRNTQFVLCKWHAFAVRVPLHPTGLHSAIYDAAVERLSHSA